jgi:hypothetical protein
MNFQDAVSEFGRHFIFLDSIGDVDRAFPASPDALVPAKLFVGDSRRRGTLTLQSQHPIPHRQFEILRRHAWKFRREQILAVELIEIDGRKLTFEAEHGKWKGKALKEPINLPFQIAERLPRISPAKNRHRSTSGTMERITLNSDSYSDHPYGSTKVKAKPVP